MSAEAARLTEWEIIAIHEAGHAVIAARLGCRPSRFELHVRDLGNRWQMGGCVHTPDPPAGGYSDAIVIAIGGRTAERDFGAPARQHDPRDDAEIKRFLDEVSPPLSPKARRQAIRIATSRARGLVSANRLSIALLADAAIERLQAETDRVRWPCKVAIDGDSLAALLQPD